MSAIKIVVCQTPHQANVAAQVMRDLGFTCHLNQFFNDIIWDATQAIPPPPCTTMALMNQIVVICTKP